MSPSASVTTPQDTRHAAIGLKPCSYITCYHGNNWQCSHLTFTFFEERDGKDQRKTQTQTPRVTSPLPRKATLTTLSFGTATRFPACDVMLPIRPRSLPPPPDPCVLDEDAVLLGGARAWRIIVRAKLMSDGRARGPSAKQERRYKILKNRRWAGAALKMNHTYPSCCSPYGYRVVGPGWWAGAALEMNHTYPSCYSPYGYRVVGPGWWAGVALEMNHTYPSCYSPYGYRAVGPGWAGAALEMNQTCPSCCSPCGYRVVGPDWWAGVALKITTLTPPAAAHVDTER